QEGEACAGACAARGNKSCTKQREKECHQDVPKNQCRKMITKIGFSSPKCWHFLMRAMHQLPVPKEAKQKHETEGCDKCDEEFFPVHNVFVFLEFSRIPLALAVFIAKLRGRVDLKILAARNGGRVTR